MNKSNMEGKEVDIEFEEKEMEVMLTKTSNDNATSDDDDDDRTNCYKTLKLSFFAILSVLSLFYLFRISSNTNDPLEKKFVEKLAPDNYRNTMYGHIHVAKTGVSEDNRRLEHHAVLLLLSKPSSFILLLTPSEYGDNKYDNK